MQELRHHFVLWIWRFRRERGEKKGKRKVKVLAQFKNGRDLTDARLCSPVKPIKFYRQDTGKERNEREKEKKKKREVRGTENEGCSSGPVSDSYMYDDWGPFNTRDGAGYYFKKAFRFWRLEWPRVCVSENNLNWRMG